MSLSKRWLAMNRFKPDRRRQVAELHGGQENDAEVDRIDAVLRGDRQQQRHDRARSRRRYRGWRRGSAGTRAARARTSSVPCTYSLTNANRRCGTPVSIMRFVDASDTPRIARIAPTSTVDSRMMRGTLAPRHLAQNHELHDDDVQRRHGRRFGHGEVPAVDAAQARRSAAASPSAPPRWRAHAADHEPADDDIAQVAVAPIAIDREHHDHQDARAGRRRRTDRRSAPPRRCRTESAASDGANSRPRLPDAVMSPRLKRSS